jgi:hypothetical protein
MAISDDYHQIEIQLRYLTMEEGGRQSGVFSGYRTTIASNVLVK